jgi:hypothetical protein
MSEERIQQLVNQAMAAVEGAVSDPRGQIESTIRQAIAEARAEGAPQEVAWWNKAVEERMIRDNEEGISLIKSLCDGPSSQVNPRKED